MKLLSVYNICGISKRENLDYYLKALYSLYDQKNIEHDIVISSCLSSTEILDQLINIFPNIKINSIKDKVPVNVSFNHTCKVFDDGTYDGFLYIDSGIVFTKNDTLYNMVQKFESGPYPMVCCLTDTDRGVSIDKIDGLDGGDGLVSDDNGYCVSVGSSLNLHCQIFSREIKDYFGNIIPDVFAGYCTESVFSFICASIKGRWAVTSDEVKHAISVDGQSSGFHPSFWIQSTGRETYDHPFIIETYMDRILNPKAKAVGLGFEECRYVLMHDKTQYDKNMFCINNDLRQYIKNNLYLKTNEFNYSQINYQLYTKNNIIKNNDTISAPKMYPNGWSIDYKISVIIPTRERPELLTDCLNSLLDKSYKNNRLFEVILLIDNDDPETLKTAINLQSKFSFTNILDNTKCNSLSIIVVDRSEYMQRDYNNVGAVAAKGDLVFVLNDDAIMNTLDWDKIIYDFYLENKNLDDIMFLAITDDTHDAVSLDSLGRIRDSETHGPCFPIVTKTFVKYLRGIFPSNIRMWGADIVLYSIFKQVDRVYKLHNISISHNSFHSGNRAKDTINERIKEISDKPQYLPTIPEYITYLQSILTNNHG